MAVGALAVEKLGEYVRERRDRDKLSLRQAADQAHVSFNTLARVERGHIPDLATFMKLVSWLGLDPQYFFTPRQRRGETTPQIVTELLRNDPNLAAGAWAGWADPLRLRLRDVRGDAEPAHAPDWVA